MHRALAYTLESVGNAQGIWLACTAKVPAHGLIIYQIQINFEVLDHPAKSNNVLLRRKVKALRLS